MGITMIDPLVIRAEQRSYQTGVLLLPLPHTWQDRQQVDRARGGEGCLRVGQLICPGAGEDTRVQLHRAGLQPLLLGHRVPPGAPIVAE